LKIHLWIPTPSFGHHAYYPESVGRYREFPSHAESRAAGHFAYYNLHLVCAGRGQVKIGSEWLELQRGAGFLFPPHSEQHYRADPEDPWDVRWVHFSAGQGGEWIKQHAGRSGWVFAIGELSSVEALTEEMYRIGEAFATKEESRISALLYELLVRVGAEARNLRESSSSVRREAIRDSADLIRERCAENWRLTEMAELAGYSPYHYNRLFHETMGRTPMAYLNEARIMQAKRLLVSTRSSVKEIAFACGFKQSGYFVTRFRKQEGMTPTRYREAFGSTHADN
jgi:AraC-like DNA-binding protein